ncbi:MAG TPA: hypothetical protein VK908_16620 [Jiangellales bacterium]|nr:hypothetical protein [Jiangellales bacterium]
MRANRTVATTSSASAAWTTAAGCWSTCRFQAARTWSQSGSVGVATRPWAWTRRAEKPSVRVWRAAMVVMADMGAPVVPSLSVVGTTVLPVT